MSDQTFWKSVPPTLIGMGKSNKLCNLDLFIHAGNVDFCKGRYMHRYKGQGLGVSTRGNKVHKLSGGTSAHKVYKRCWQDGVRLVLKSFRRYLASAWGTSWLALPRLACHGWHAVVVGRLYLGSVTKPTTNGQRWNNYRNILHWSLGWNISALKCNNIKQLSVGVKSMQWSGKAQFFLL